MPNPNPGDVHVPGTRRGRRLKNLVLDRVDLVHAPANPGARVKMFKGEDELEKHPGHSDQDVHTNKGMNRHDVDKRIVSEDGKFAVYDREGKKRLGTYDSKEEAVARLRQIEGFKKSPEHIGGNMALDKSKLSEAVRKHLDELETSDPVAAEALSEALEAAQAVEAPAAAPVDAVAKSEFAQIQKALEDERAARLASEERIAKMEGERKLANFVALAKADLEPIGKADELAEILLVVSEAVPEDTYKSLERVLKGAAAKLATGDLFKQRADLVGDPSDAETKIDELAKDAVKNGFAKTIEQGKLHVLKSHPELYAEYRAARDAQ